jgi:DNA-binding MarR family transcriptional regulator
MPTLENAVADIPPVYGQFGQTLAYAERTLTAVLTRHLAQRATEPETWYALRLTAASGPRISRERLINELAGSPNLDPASAHELADRLEAQGLLRGNDAVTLTAKGEALYRSLREFVLGATARLLGQFDQRDIETTVQTLQAITARAAADSS